MSKTSRRNLLKLAAGGSMTAGLGWGLADRGTALASAPQGRGRHATNSGPLATAVVSFGQWQSDPPLDRHPNLSDLTRAGHHLIPSEVMIKAGGTVNYIIAGLHQVAVYDEGIQPAQINSSMLIPLAAGSPPLLIDDPVGRIYRGQDPSVLPFLSIPPAPAPPPAPQQVVTDRVEVVQFSRPGTFLVICTVLPHFAAGMFGWVRVLP